MNSKKIIMTIVPIAALIGITALLIFQDGEAQSSTYDGPKKALIIDQLYDEYPNEAFHKKAIEYLELAGFEVDVVKTKDVTVDFYSNLGKMNYQYVVVRTHGANNEGQSDVVLFTGEKYTEEKYIQEQLFGQIKKAAPILEVAYQVNDDEGNSEWIIINDTTRMMKSPAKMSTNTENAYFAISPKFVSDNMKGSFDDTIFILGGCNTLENPSLAKSLIDKGASVVVGWDDTVGSVDNDGAILTFLETSIEMNYDLESTMDIVQKRFLKELMPYPATMIHYSEA